MCSPQHVQSWYQSFFGQFNTVNFSVKRSSTMGVLDVRHRDNMPPHDISLSEMKATRMLSERWFMSLFSDVFPHARDLQPTLYICLAKSDEGNWEAYCDDQSRELGLCAKNPVHAWTSELRQATQDLGRAFRGACLIPIHLNIEWWEAGQLQGNHANTLLFHPKTRTIWVFDPKGELNFGKYVFLRLLRTLSQKIGCQFRGYLTPKCDFQIDNEEFCFVWTTWVECLARWNPWLTPTQLAKYLKKRYQKFYQNYQTRETAIQFCHYLKELSQGY